MSDEPDEFIFKAVVLNGRVVLDAPLALPDGTLVTIQRYAVGDLPGEDGEPAGLAYRVRHLAEALDVQAVRLRALERLVKRQDGQDAA